MEKNNKKGDHIAKAVDITLKLGLLLLLLGWCFKILSPFINMVIWAIIIAVTIFPLYKFFLNRSGKKKKLSAIITTLLLLSVLIVPSIKFASSMVEGIKSFGVELEHRDILVPPPPEKVAEWPLIGDVVYTTWELASDNLEGLLKKYKNELIAFGNWLFNALVGTGMGLLQFIISIIIAGILLIGSDKEYEMSRKFFRKIVGEKRGEEYAATTEVTIRQVAKGVIGVAFIQAFLLGIVFLLAGVPYAGLWALLCLILIIIQIGPLPVNIGIIIYLYYVDSVLIATLWTILIILFSLLDNILKPLLMGKGAPVPMLVIFIGSLGGMIVSGFLGLFIGAIILSLGYKLFIAWINSEDETNLSGLKS